MRYLGNDVWKANANSTDFDSALILSRLQLLQRNRDCNDVNAMMYLLRSGDFLLYNYPL